MQLEEAASRIRTLINFYDGLKHLEEVLEAARVADQLQKERNALAAQAGKELDAVQAKLAAAKDEHGTAIAKLKDQQKRLESNYAEKSRELEDSFATRSGELAEELTRTKQLINEAHAEYDAFILQSNDQKALIQADIDKLEKALSNLKSKVGGML